MNLVRVAQWNTTQTVAKTLNTRALATMEKETTMKSEKQRERRKKIRDRKKKEKREKRKE